MIIRSGVYVKFFKDILEAVTFTIYSVLGLVWLVKTIFMTPNYTYTYLFTHLKAPNHSKIKEHP